MEMRQIVLDTETTGLDPALGHRIIEIAAVELVNRRPTHKHFQRYVNPERDSEEAALQIHGLTREFLSDKPKFREIAADFLEFITGAELIIHNAAFDIAFVNHELSLLGLQPIAACCPPVIDTLKLARELNPGKRNGLDALCDRYQIGHSARTLHGALLDAQLLAEVYLAMTRGQDSLVMEETTVRVATSPVNVVREAPPLTVLRVTPEERAAHEEHLADLDGGTGGCLWRQLREDSESLPVRAA